jgi:photosystem II stability/assembly factor-like uncharacterized protein
MGRILLFILFFTGKTFGQWLPVLCPTIKDLNSVHFANQNVGYIGGNGDTTTILKSTDSGNTWISINTASVYGNCYSLHCSNADTVFFQCSQGYIVTKDSGSNWAFKGLGGFFGTSIFSFPPNFMYILGSVYCQSPNVHVPYAFAVAIKSNDCGLTYNAFEPYSGGTPYCIHNDILTSIYFVDTLIGYACGPNAFAKTINGGSTWFNLNSYIGNSLFFLNKNLGWTAGNNGVIHKTTDGGSTWVPQFTPVGQSLNSIHFSTPDTGCAVGNRGVILGTVDGGNTWFQQYSGTTEDLKSVYFTDRQTGFIVGNHGTIFKTTNGPVGLKESALEKPPQIFPNPVNGFLNINIKGSPSLLQIFNVSGVEIINQDLKEFSNRVDLSPLSRGLYILKISNSKGCFAQKIIKE